MTSAEFEARARLGIQYGSQITEAERPALIGMMGQVEGELQIKEGSEDDNRRAQGVDIFRNVIREGVFDAHSFVESLLGSMLIGGWSAFEIFAKDLWVSALNVECHLADHLLTPKEKDERTIPMNVLRVYDYDLSSRMGEMLIFQKKFKFDALSDILTAYKAAFGVEAERIFNAYPDLRSLELIRIFLPTTAGLSTRRSERRRGKGPI